MYTENINEVLSPIYRLGTENGNTVFIKREDFIPFSFGGNKARKAQLFFEEIKKGGYDCVVTYGSSSSNHCRIVCNMAAQMGIESYVIEPQEESSATFNLQMMEWFGASFIVVPVHEVAVTIQGLLNELNRKGKRPYFIAGGGHGNIGTQAFVNCYEEIKRYEQENSIHFDYVFHASGTGTTQAGLVCGQLMHNDERKIVGISIARRNPRGRDVVLESVRSYLEAQGISASPEAIEKATIFDDSYIGEGYGHINSAETITRVMKKYGVPLDATYTGKAFMGMLDYLRHISGCNVLFVHTGGTPLFFDFIKTRE